MKQIRNKNDLLAWLEKNAPRKAVANAMIDGRTELYGFFNPAPNSSLAGWVVKITSKRKMSWNVIVTIGKLGLPVYHVYTIKSVSWENYVGGDTPLFAGDNPAEYKHWQFINRNKELNNEKQN